MADCVYVSHSAGVHDQRWMAGLRSLGHSPVGMSFPDTSMDPEHLRHQVSVAADARRPVLAGPLGSITKHLVPLPGRLIGLSWGFDLHGLAATGDTSWLPQLDGLIVDSEATREIALAAGLAPDRITHLPWGIDIDRFCPEGPVLAPSDLGLPPECRIVLSLRAHEAAYRVDDVLRAFADVAMQVPESALVVGHSGSLTGELREAALRLGIDERTSFIGTIDEAALPALLRAARCYVTASAVDGTSVSLLQAMCVGVPVVASDNPGNRDWVTPGETGLTFATGDVVGLAQAMLQALLEDCSLWTLPARNLVLARADWSRNLHRLGDALFPPT